MEYLDISSIFDYMDFDNNSINYLAIGAAANINDFSPKLRYQDFQIGNNNHQFPPVLFNFFTDNMNSSFKMNLIFIDDRLEDPLFIIEELVNKYEYSFKNYKNYANIWVSVDNKIKIYAVKELFDFKYQNKIKLLCDNINASDSMLLFHDFSGLSFHKDLGKLYQKFYNPLHIRFSITNHQNINEYLQEFDSDCKINETYPKLNENILFKLKIIYNKDRYLLHL